MNRMIGRKKAIIYQSLTVGDYSVTMDICLNYKFCMSGDDIANENTTIKM